MAEENASDPSGPTIPNPRDISAISTDEADTYLSVSGWRMWVLGLEDSLEHRMALDKATAKPLALKMRAGGKGWDEIDAKYMNALYGGSQPPRYGNADLPTYFLEPLTQDEVRAIDENGQASGPLGTVDKPGEIVRPQELRAILQSPKSKS